ncbi:hypothetical protein RUND412_001827 [Rhizina undulata]
MSAPGNHFLACHICKTWTAVKNPLRPVSASNPRTCEDCSHACQQCNIIKVTRTPFTAEQEARLERKLDINFRRSRILWTCADLRCRRTNTVKMKWLPTVKEGEKKYLALNLADYRYETENQETSVEAKSNEDDEQHTVEETTETDLEQQELKALNKKNVHWDAVEKLQQVEANKNRRTSQWDPKDKITREEYIGADGKKVIRFSRAHKAVTTELYPDPKPKEPRMTSLDILAKYNMNWPLGRKYL